MNVINQVLTQLEQRGAQPPPEQTMVRAVVPYARRSFAMPVLMAGIVLLGVFGVWQSVQTHKPNVATGNIVRGSAATPPSAMVAAPAAVQIEARLPAPQLNPDAGSLPSAPHEAVKGSERNKVAEQVAGGACAQPCPQYEKPAVHPRPRQLPKTVAVVQPANQPGSNSAAPVNRNPAPQTPGSQGQPQPAPILPANAAAVAPDVTAALPVKRVSNAQQADAEFRKASASMQQGRVSEAQAGYEAALRLDTGHDAARQALVALLLEGKRGADAERVLQEGLKNKPEHTGFAMLLARLQVERGAVELATATLEKSLPYADTQADYQAFFAALLQRQNRHKEAVNHYQIALQLVPDKGVWLMGYGISLQAVQRNEDARAAYRRALDSKTLSPELQAFVQQRLKSL